MCTSFIMSVRTSVSIVWMWTRLLCYLGLLSLIFLILWDILIFCNWSLIAEFLVQVLGDVVLNHRCAQKQVFKYAWLYCVQLRSKTGSWNIVHKNVICVLASSQTYSVLGNQNSIHEGFHNLNFTVLKGNVELIAEENFLSCIGLSYIIFNQECVIACQFQTPHSAFFFKLLFKRQKMKKSIYLKINHMLSITGHTSILMVHMILLKYLIILVSLWGLSGYLVCPYQIHSGS